MQGEHYVGRFDAAVPTTWDLKTGEVNNAAAAWARSPDGRWELALESHPNAGGYNIELNRLGAQGGPKGLHSAATVHSPNAVSEIVEEHIRDIGGQYNRRNDRVRRGEVDDSAGLFDDLGW
jgi:hypothetical protein